ncbi:MAG: hypothetical protein H8K03_15955 [Nitrospira sp.]|nr:hypothetical protein [Nitrospira sp. BO4]
MTQTTIKATYQQRDMRFSMGVYGRNGKKRDWAPVGTSRENDEMQLLELINSSSSQWKQQVNQTSPPSLLRWVACIE